MTPTLSIIIATSGRPTLIRTLQSLAPQLEHGDELLVIRRDDAPKGNTTRDEAMPRAAGSHLWWADDDDVATDDALAIIRREVGRDPGAVHVFRMEGDVYHDGVRRVLWEDPAIRFGNVGGSMVVVPNIPGCLGTWEHPPVDGGDFHFLSGTLALLGRGPVWHPEIVALIRP